MHVIIDIVDDLGEPIGHATSNTIEGAVQELYRWERNADKKKHAEQLEASMYEHQREERTEEKLF